MATAVSDGARSSTVQVHGTGGRSGKIPEREKKVAASSESVVVHASSRRP